ncbi:EAL domain-containing protein [Colwelliaceae bacterium 6441]
MSNSLKKITSLYRHNIRRLILGILIANIVFVFTNHWLNGQAQWSILYSSISLSVIISLFLSSFWYRALLVKHIKHIIALEKWADLSKICGEIQAVPNSKDSLSDTINTLYKQLQIAKNSDSRLDNVLRSNALLDKDTGVGNREFFNNRLEALLKEEDIQGAVFFIQFNDVDLVHSLYGEQQAITLLNTLVHTLKNRLQSLAKYFVARRGELELAVIAPDIFFNDAEKLAEKLLKSLAAVPLPVGVNKDEFIHIGVSYFSQAENAYQVKSEADMALRSAQLQGPSQWFMYDPGEVEHSAAKGSLKWRTFLTHAINKNAFVIFFQPVISSINEAILHHEVLAKVRDSDGSLISARVFLPMAKKCGMTQQIDLLVLKQVCRILSYDTSEEDHCSLNLSIESLLSEEFVKQFMQVLTAHPNIYHRLIIEISEYHLVNHLAQIKPVLVLLHQLGIQLLADKVGQHVVSAEYLKICPINMIKLHRSLVLNIHQKPENQIFIQSLKGISDVHQIEVYALGVESIDEWQTLKRLGIHGGQGHFFTEPVAQVAKAIHLN